MRIIVYSFISLIILFSISCDAPRNNPLDPLGSKEFGVIEGTVQTYSVPYTGVPDALIYFDAGNALVNTDANGHFQISRVQTINGRLIISKEGFRTDTVNIVWNGLKKISTQVNLNIVPIIDSLNLYTVVMNQYNTNPTYELAVGSSIKDKDNDVDSVYVSNSTFGLIKALAFNTTENIYQTVLNSQELLASNITDLEQIIGENFEIVVKDVFNRYYIVGSSKVTRVIKNEVENLTPAGGDTTGQYPTFRWTRFKPGYSFSYTIEIYTNDLANSQLVLRKDKIDLDKIDYICTVALPQGGYYWVIWIVDQFQNRSRSKPKTFEVN